MNFYTNLNMDYFVKFFFLLICYTLNFFFLKFINFFPNFLCHSYDFPPNRNYSFYFAEAEEDLLGIHIYRSDCLKIDRILKHPSVTVHIVDSENNGLYLQKSKPNKNVTYNQERSSFILPVMTRPFNFRDNK